MPPESPDELGAALIRLLSNPVERAALGIAGRSRVEREFKLSRMVERAEGLYAEVIRSSLAGPTFGPGGRSCPLSRRSCRS